jgi:RNA polymerase subunit RPABC4/transcription elongation factor Spt4
MKCNACGTDLTGELRFCPHCGEKLKSKKGFKCDSCDEVLESHWKFCPICGKSVLTAQEPKTKKTSKTTSDMSFQERTHAIYESTAQDNCGECGCRNCMQFAMKAASEKNPTEISDCPYIDDSRKRQSSLYSW